MKGCNKCKIEKELSEFNKNIHNKKTAKKFPKATVWGVEGFDKKRPDIKWDKTLTATQWPYSDELEILELKGSSRVNETVFFIKALAP
jgi:hypothetical protein